MKINLVLGTKPIMKRPYTLAHEYKEIVKKEIENMPEVGIIYTIYKFANGPALW